MRVLMLAFECNPDWYSLPAVAFNYCKVLAQYVDELVVVTQIQNKENIERHGDIPGLKFIFLNVGSVVDPFESLASFLMGGHKKNVGWTLYRALIYPAYVYFEWVAWRELKTQLKSGHFDIVHRLTPMTPTLPSPMVKLSPVPFVLGPLNGGLLWPKQFRNEQNREREWLSNFRNLYKVLPYQKSTYENADVILAAFDHTIADLPLSSLDKVIDFPEVGIDPELFTYSERPSKEKLTILYVGRLVPYKMPEVVLEAFAQSPILQKHQLIMVGDGAERESLEKMVHRNNLQSCVSLLGQVSHENVSCMMREADIFAFPSIRELGAGAVIEAMASGLACVVVDYGGCGGLIDSDRGVKVSMGDKDHLIQSFVDELENLVKDPEKARKLGLEAYNHAIAYYSWQAKAKKNIEVYEWALSKKSETKKPNFWE